MKFTFDWNPDRDPAIRLVGKAVDAVEWWAAIAAEEHDPQPDDVAALIDLNDFADDMAVYMLGLRLGYANDFTQALLDQHRNHAAARDLQPVSALRERLRDQFGVRVGVTANFPGNTGTTPE